MSLFDEILLSGINSGFKAIQEAKRSVLKDVEQAAKRQRVKVEQVIKATAAGDEAIDAEFIDDETKKEGKTHGC